MSASPWPALQAVQGPRMRQTAALHHTSHPFLQGRRGAGRKETAGIEEGLQPILSLTRSLAW